MRCIRPLLALALIAASLAYSSTPASAMHGNLSGTVTDITSGVPVNNVCVTIGPPVRCATNSKADGTWFVDLAGAPDGLQWDVRFLLGGQIKKEFLGVVVNGPTVINAQIDATGFVTPPACAALNGATPTATNYMPNITKTLGGPTGWQTPFIVQNTGAASATLEVSWYKFIDGSCAKRINVTRAPGTSFAYIPNNDSTIPDNTQFSVVVRSYGSTVVSVVNEHQGSADRAEAMSYNGFSGGTLSVFLPNITRRFFGFVTPFIIQNLGTATTTATATFRPFDGSSGPIVITRTIDAGRAKQVDPNSNDPNLGAPGLTDGKQYAVTVNASQPVAVVVNTQNDAPGVAAPLAASTDGVTAGAATVYGAYAAKNAAGRRTPIIVQNLGGTAVAPAITFTPLTGGAGGSPNTYTFPSIQPNASKAF